MSHDQRTETGTGTMGQDRQTESDASSGSGSVETVDGMKSDRRPLWVVIEIDVGTDCPIVGIDQPIHDIDLQQMGGVCRSEVVTESEDVEVLHME
ncbi:MAG: hypothetical protein V5A23_01755, partial [Halobacteriales archaeon]